MALTVIHYTGHRVTGLAEARVAVSIGVHLDRAGVVAAYGSLASGADTLFAEACRARGVPVHVFLPFGAARFKAASVRPAGEPWVARFDIALAAAASVTIMPAGRAAGFAPCARAAMAAALAAASAGGHAALQLAVWDGVAPRGAAGTAADVAWWRGLGGVTAVVDPFYTTPPGD